MAKKTAIAILAENLRDLMDRHPALSSSPKVARKSGASARTVNNMENSRHDAKLSSVEAVAKSFGLEAYQLLCPSSDKNFVEICRAWNVADPVGRELLLGAAETVNRRHGGSTKSGTGDR